MHPCTEQTKCAQLIRLPFPVFSWLQSQTLTTILGNNSVIHIQETQNHPVFPSNFNIWGACVCGKCRTNDCVQMPARHGQALAGQGRELTWQLNANPVRAGSVKNLKKEVKLQSRFSENEYLVLCKTDLERICSQLFLSAAEMVTTGLISHTRHL